MKRFFSNVSLLFASLVLTVTGFAQTPAGINYQAAARNASGDLLSNKALVVKAVIATGPSGSNVEYTETHNVSTNDYGVFNIIIGQGSTSNNFGSLDWGAKKHHLKIEIDTGSGFVNMGTVAFEAVPYALSAKNVENMPTINMDDLGDVNSSGATSGQVLQWNGTAWVPTTISGGGSISAGSGLTLSGGVMSANNTQAIWNANKIQGGDVSNTTPSNGQVLKWNGSLWAPDIDNTGTNYSAGTGIAIASGVISANNTSALWNSNQLQGRTLTNTAPTSGQVIKWNGTSWAPGTDNAGSTYTAGAGLSLNTNTFSADSNRAIWNAGMLNGTSVSSSTPTTGQVLEYNGTSWAPKTLAAAPTGPWSSIGTGWASTYRAVGIGIDTALGAFHVRDTITATGNAQYVSSIIESEASTGAQAYSNGLWINIDGRNGYANRGIRCWAGDSANNTYVGGGAYGGQFWAQTIGGQNNFGVRADAGEGGSVRNYAVYAESEGDGTFNMGVFAYCHGAHSSASKTNYGIYAWADSAQTNYAGYFAGNVSYTGTLASASDARLKTNVHTLEDALSKILNVQVKTYEYKNTGTAAKMNLPKGTQIGFIAQDLEKTFPQLVETQHHAIGAQTDDEGKPLEDPETIEYKAVNYIGMIPVLTKAIQEQQAQIEELKRQIELLQSQLK